MVQPVITLAKLVTSSCAIAGADAERMQLQNFARQIFVQALAAAYAGDRVRPDRAGVVEIDQHRRMGLGREQHVGEVAEHMRPDRLALVGAAHRAHAPVPCRPRCRNGSTRTTPAARPGRCRPASRRRSAPWPRRDKSAAAPAGPAWPARAPRRASPFPCWPCRWWPYPDGRSPVTGVPPAFGAVRAARRASRRSCRASNASRAASPLLRRSGSSMRPAPGFSSASTAPRGSAAMASIPPGRGPSPKRCSASAACIFGSPEDGSADTGNSSNVAVQNMRASRDHTKAARFPHHERRINNPRLARDMPRSGALTSVWCRAATAACHSRGVSTSSMSRVFMSRAFTFAAVLATAARRRNTGLRAAPAAQGPELQGRRRARAGGAGRMSSAQLALLGGRGRSRRRHPGHAARRQRRPAHHGERAAQGLHGADVQDDLGGILAAHGEGAGAPAAGDVAGDHRYSGRRADQGRRRRDRRVGLSGSPGKDADCIKVGLDKVQQYLQ